MRRSSVPDGDSPRARPERWRFLPARSQGGAFYRLDVTSGTFTRLLPKDTEGRILSPSIAVASDDRTLLTAVRSAAGSPWTRIVAMDLVTGRERAVAQVPGLGDGEGPGLALDPAERTLAIHATDGRILTVGIDGTNIRELYQASQGNAVPTVRWAPDGRSILFFTAGAAPQGGGRLMRISRSGGEPQVDGLDAWELDSTFQVARSSRRAFSVWTSMTTTRELRSARALCGGTTCGSSRTSCAVPRDGLERTSRHRGLIAPARRLRHRRRPRRAGGGRCGRRTGGEILFLQPSVLGAGTMMVAPVEPGRTFSAGSPRALFEVGFTPPFSGRSFDVSTDGRRLLMIELSARQDDPAPPPQLVVVLNWIEGIEELKRTAAGPGR